MNFSFNPNEDPLPQARQLWNVGRRDEALHLFGQAFKKNKRNLSVVMDQARALGASYRIKEAERVLHELLPLRRDLPILHLLIGQIYREIRRPRLAMEAIQRMVEANPNSYEARLELVSLYEHFGQPKEAIKHAMAAMRLAPSDPLPELLVVGLQAAELNPTEKVTEYRDFLKKHSRTLSPGLEARALAEYAKVLIEVDPKEGLEVMRRSHELLADRRGENLARGRAMAKRGREFCAPLVPGMIGGWRDQLEPEERQRVLFLLGFPRSGTTLLEKQLAASDLFHDAEELDLFGQYIQPLLVGTLVTIDDESSRSREALRFLRTRYLNGMSEYFGGLDTGRWILDKNPSNTLLGPSLARVFPEGRFLVMLRDPRDTLLSAYLLHVPKNPESVFFQDWDDLVERYVETLRMWLELRSCLPQDAWREVRYEDLVEGQERVFDELRAWLDLGEGADVVEAVEMGYVSSPSNLEVRQAIHGNRVGRWSHPEIRKIFEGRLETKLRPILEELGYD